MIDERDYTGKNTIAPYRCSCGNIQTGRTIHYFRNKSWRCKKCAKEMISKNSAYRFEHDYMSVKINLLSEDKELLTYKEYFKKDDYISYRCLLCNKVSTIKFSSYMTHDYSCNSCRIKDIRNKRWEHILELASDSNAKIITNLDEYQNGCDRITVLCNCGEIFDTNINEFIFGGKRQCNQCGIVLRSGENSPMWNGGVTPESEKIRRSKEYIKWRNSVFLRDNYICQCCGEASGGNLNAHHIYNFSEYTNMRFDINNGITMCDACHNPNKVGSFHYVYGTHNNTPE